MVLSFSNSYEGAYYILVLETATFEITVSVVCICFEHDADVDSIKLDKERSCVIVFGRLGLRC